MLLCLILLQRYRDLQFEGCYLKIVVWTPVIAFACRLHWVILFVLLSATYIFFLTLFIILFLKKKSFLSQTSVSVPPVCDMCASYIAQGGLSVNHWSPGNKHTSLNHRLPFISSSLTSSIEAWLRHSPIIYRWMCVASSRWDVWAQLDDLFTILTMCFLGKCSTLKGRITSEARARGNKPECDLESVISYCGVHSRWRRKSAIYIFFLFDCQLFWQTANLKWPQNISWVMRQYDSCFLMLDRVCFC